MEISVSDGRFIGVERGVDHPRGAVQIDDQREPGFHVGRRINPVIHPRAGGCAPGREFIPLPALGIYRRLIGFRKTVSGNDDH